MSVTLGCDPSPEGRNMDHYCYRRHCDELASTAQIFNAVSAVTMWVRLIAMAELRDRTVGPRKH